MPCPPAGRLTIQQRWPDRHTPPHDSASVCPQLGGGLHQQLPHLGHHLRQGGPGFGAEVAAAAAGDGIAGKAQDPGTPPTAAGAGNAASGSSEDNSGGRPLKKRQRGGPGGA